MTAQVSIDLLWILTCAMLVLVMQAGFLALEAGLTRTKNSINVAVKNLTDFALAAGVFALGGYGWIFGPSLAGWGGTELLVAVPDEPRAGALYLYELMFCGAAVTIVSGAVAERMRLVGYAAVALLISGPIYCVFAHWAWNGSLDIPTDGGWLRNRGFIDFAGSTVVHSLGGWSALAVISVIGPRKGRFGPDGPQEIPASNQPLAMLGVCLLWIGWLGFNGGSAFGLTPGVPKILINTVLSAAGGLLAGTLTGKLRHDHLKTAGITNGSLAGLVAISAGCHVLTPLEAALTGAVAGSLAILASDLLLRFRIDDVVGAVPVHAVGGFWGTVAVGLLGDPDVLGTGLSWSDQVLVQLQGALCCLIWAYGVTYIASRGIDRGLKLRVSEQSEDVGLNVAEHGARNELHTLLSAMHKQAAEGDLSLRAPVEPFTEVGQIALLYNHVLESLQRATARTDGVVRQIHQGLIMVSHDGSLLQANPACEQLFGIAAHQLAGRAAHELLVADRTADGPTSDTGERPWEGNICDRVYPMIANRPDGTGIPVEVCVAPLDVDDEVKCTALVTDVRERRRVEAELKRAAHDAQSALKAKSAFLATVSHEIRTPMHGVLGMTEILLGTPLDRVQRQHAQDVKQSAQVLLHIINEILDFSKLEAGKMTLDPAPFRPQALLDTILPMQRGLAETKGLTLKLDAGPLPTLLGDQHRIGQILTNLLGNAIKFTEAGQITVHAEARDAPSGDGVLLRIAVEDQGIGIAPDKLGAIFEQFNQAESSTTRRFGGTGLGLTICARLATLMNGEIQVASTPGAGSRFTLEVPLAYATEETRSTKPASLPATFNLRLLVAEDNTINQRIARRLFERLGCQIEIAEDGAQAIEAIRKGGFDAIFMDCQMPNMDGFEAARQILLEHTRSPPDIIAMTANAMPHDRERCLEAGMLGFVSKPVTLDTLRQALASSLERTRGTAQVGRDVASEEE